LISWAAPFTTQTVEGRRPAPSTTQAGHPPDRPPPPWPVGRRRLPELHGRPQRGRALDGRSHPSVSKTAFRHSTDDAAPFTLRRTS